MTKRRKLLEKLRAVSSSGASLHDVIILLEAYGFQRIRVRGSHWFFVYTDKDGNELMAAFPIVGGKRVKAAYVRIVVGAIDEARAESED